jgi:hypothetical protein
MLIVAKKKFQFRKTTIVDNPNANPDRPEKMAQDETTFLVEPSFSPQPAPDWIKEDGLFELAIRDKSLVVVGN